MIVAVTGATGFVGARLVARLRREGTEIRTIGHAEWEAPAALDPRLLEGAHAVVHAAAHVPASMRDPREARRCLEVNALGTLALLTAAEAAGVGRIVHLSTGNLYASSDRSAGEDAPIDPTGCATYYLWSKAVADGWARARPKVVVLRPSSIYGPGARGGVVHAFVQAVRAGTRLRVADGGRFRSDLVALDDVVDAIGLALRSSVTGPFNVGSGRTTSVLSVATTLLRLTGLGEDRLLVEPAGLGPAPGFAPLDVTRARRELGYEPRTLEEGLRAVLADGP